MIILFIINAVILFVTTILGVLPNVPATPQSVIDGGQWIIDQIAGVIGVLNMVYSQTLLAAIMVVIIAMFNFEWIYHTTMWIVRKIPIINMK